MRVPHNREPEMMKINPIWCHGRVHFPLNSLLSSGFLKPEWLPVSLPLGSLENQRGGHCLYGSQKEICTLEAGSNQAETGGGGRWQWKV